MAKKFRAQTAVEQKIVEVDGDGNEEVFGTIRVRPNAVLWKSKGARSWRGVTIEELATFIKAEGRELDK